MKKNLTLKLSLLVLVLAFAGNAFSQAVGDFRTHQSGNWNDVNTWERYNGTTWIFPAPSTPTSADGVITILPGTVAHNVTVTASVTVDQLIINPVQAAAGSLTINPGVTFTVADGTGTDVTAYFTNLTVNGTLTINSGAQLSGGGGNMGERGILKVNTGGLLTVTGSIVGIQTVPIEINISGTANIPGSVSDERFFYVNSGGVANVSGSVVLSSGANVCDLTVFAGGNLNLTGTASVTSVRGNGGAAITIAGTATLTGTSTIGVPGNVNTPSMDVVSGGVLDMGPDAMVIGKSFDLQSGATIKIASINGISSFGATGNVQNATTGGSFRNFSDGANYIYDGVSAQITGNGIPSTLTTGSLTINNAAGVTLTNTLATLTTPTLTLTNGILNGITNNKTTAIATGGTVNRTNGWVFGFLAKNLSTGAGIARTFEVGTNLRYNPMTVNFANVSVAGTLTVRTNLGDHAAIASSSIDPLRSVNLNWTAKNTGIAFDTYSATFQFVNPNDIDPLANTLNFRIQKYNGVTWGAPAGIGSRTGTTTQGTGFTTLGASDDFQVGELIGSGGPLPSLFFQSHQSGNWSDVNTWESKVSLADLTWTYPASHAPTSLDRTITVLSGHTVLVDADVTTDETIVQSGAHLDVNATKALTINDGIDGDGFDLTINGDLGGTGNVIIMSTSTGTASIGNSSGTASNTNVTVQRFIPGRRSWRFVSAPLSSVGAPTINASWQEGATTASGVPNPNAGFGTHITGGTVGDGFDQAAGNGYSLKIYTPTSVSILQEDWTGIPTTLTPITGKQGYMLFVRGSRANNLSLGKTAPLDNTTLRMTGTLKTGDQNITIAATGWTVVGNPYAAPINLNNLAKSNTSTNLADNYYVWDPRLAGEYGVGAYVNISWNGASYDKTPVGGGVSAVSQYIQSGEAFFAKQLVSGIAGNMVIKEADKNLTGSDDVFRVVSGNKTAKLRTNLYAFDTNGAPALLDGTLNSYGTAFSNALDKFDVSKITNITENLGSVREGQTLIVERRQEIGDPINLRMWQMKQREYQFEIIAENLDNVGLTTYLEDSYLKTSTPIDLSTTTLIRFVVNAEPASSAENRFTIMFAKPAIVQVSDPAITVYPNPVTNGIINLRLTGMPQGNYTVRVLNGMGQTVVNKVINHAAGSGTETIQARGLTKGIYQIEVVKPDNSKFTSKILAN